MRRTFLVGATFLLVAGASTLLAGPTAAARRAGSRAAVTVTPSAGDPSTTFRVSFTAPDRTGTHHGLRRYYAVGATGPGSGQSCTSLTGRDANASHAGARVRVRLKPGAQGWCVGTFRGSVTELERPVCHHQPCPQYILLLRTIGRFTFHLKASSARRDDAPPVFAGLKSAMACTPGPERPGEKTQYHLRWDPAHDNVTPASQIVYDIFMANAPGGENFAKPRWTSKPGATAFTTPGLLSSQTFYFVVRARDRAGNEDQNRVERRGVDPCV
jgi:hypothetical protein